MKKEKLKKSFGKIAAKTVEIAKSERTRNLLVLFNRAATSKIAKKGYNAAAILGGGLLGFALITGGLMEAYSDRFDPALTSFTNEKFGQLGPLAEGNCYYIAPDKEAHISFTYADSTPFLDIVKDVLPFLESKSHISNLGTAPVFDQAACSIIRDDIRTFDSAFEANQLSRALGQKLKTSPQADTARKAAGDKKGFFLAEIVPK